MGSRSLRLGIVVLILAVLCAGPVFAHKSKSTARLRALEKHAEQSRAKAAALAQRSAGLEKELDARRDGLTAAAAEVRAAEEALSRIEDQRAALADRKARDTALLTTERARLAHLTSGLARLVRVPPGERLAWPGGPVDAARGEMLLDAALSSVKSQAENARHELAELDETEATLAEKEREAEAAAAELKSRQATLAALVEQREKLYRETENDRAEAEKQAEAASNAARDLKDLMARIEAERHPVSNSKLVSHAPAVQTAPRPGLPVAGEVKVRFGQKDGVGQTARGITLLSRPGAAVVAPQAGIVRFAGPFRGYRQILILEHPGGYHSLIAGMARIDVAVGASLGAGEPVGMMDDRPGAKPELYFELRHDGQPVDPMGAVSAVDAKGTVR